jgi:aldehyde dehydrogenase (NAD+)
MARTVASLIGGRAREGAPGGTLEIPNPTRLVDVVATARLGDPTTFVEACAAARDAQPRWARVPAPVRGRAIQLSRLIEENAGRSRT